jgi:hypothetical protein
MKPTIMLAAALVAVGDALPDGFERFLQRRQHITFLEPIYDAALAKRTWLKSRESVESRDDATVVPVQSPKVPAALNTVTSQGCYKSSGNLTSFGTPDYNSSGRCATVCTGKGYAVSATTAGNQCWCGQAYPPKGDLVADSNCNVGCAGYPQEACE